MQTGVVKVLQVVGRQVNTQRGQSVVYDISASDGRKYGTFDADLANKANSYAGQDVVLDYEERQKGQYTNYDLKGISQASGVQSAGGDIPGASSIPVATQADQAAEKVEKERRITMLSSFGSAAEIVGHLFSGAGPEAADEAVAVWMKIAKAEYDKVMGTGAEPAPEPEIKPADTPPEGEQIPWS